MTNFKTGGKVIMKGFNKLFTLVLSVSVLINSFFVLNTTAHSQENITAYENIAIDEIEKVLCDSYSKFYDINSVISEAANSIIDEDTFTTEIHTTLNTVLKAKSAQELPFVQGMIQASDSFNIKSPLSDNNREEISTFIENKVADLEKYIGMSSDSNFWLYVDAKIVNGSLDLKTLNIMAENIDRLVPINDILPASAAEQMEDGISQMTSVIDKAVITNKTTEIAPNAYTAYRRIAARDYALSFVGKNVSKCYKHGTSCGVYQDPTQYNANFSYFLHNDCANFVSQCLNAGDVWSDSVWYPDSYAWVNTQGLKNYMLSNKGYWYASSYADANAGAVLYTSSSHVVLITLNDTVTHRFTGHTNDRYNVAFTHQSGYAYYML